MYVLGRSVYIEAAGVVQDHKYIESEESVAAPPSPVLIACLNTDHGRRPLLLGGVLALDMTCSRSGRRVALFTVLVMIFEIQVQNVFTARKRSLGQGNIYTPVCHSVHGGST